MAKISVVIALFACTCRGSREQGSEKATKTDSAVQSFAEIDQSKEQGKPGRVTALALLLAAAGPGTKAFSPSGASRSSSKLTGDQFVEELIKVTIAQDNHDQLNQNPGEDQLDKMLGVVFNAETAEQRERIAVHGPGKALLDEAVVAQDKKGRAPPIDLLAQPPVMQQVNTKVDFENMVDTLAAGAILSPTGWQPAIDIPYGIVGSSPALAGLTTFFRKNPEGLVALPLAALGGGLSPDDDWNGQSTEEVDRAQREELDDYRNGERWTEPRGDGQSTEEVDRAVRKWMEHNRGGQSSIGLSGEVPDERRRTLMNLILVGGTTVPAGGTSGYTYVFFPPTPAGGAGAGLVGKDAKGDAVMFASWLKRHDAGDHNIVRDAHYLIVTADSKIGDYALNAVCTRLGCSAANDKFMCPCQGSQYDATGKVVRGPAPLSLALAHVDNVDDEVTLTPWTEPEFRTDSWN